jgi:hypothetical protein
MSRWRVELEKALALSSSEHGSDFWNRSKMETRQYLWAMLDPIGDDELPPVNEMVLESLDGSIPGYVYDQGASKIGLRDREEVESPDVGLLLGLAAYNRELLAALPTVSRLRMLVLSGEKVFRDNMFWRRLSAADREVSLEVLLLDPKSEAVGEIEATAYKDRDPGFLRSEIQDNLIAIERVSSSFRSSGKPISIECRLYRERPRVRLTILDDSRVLLTPYLLYAKTGSHTPFVSLHTTAASKLMRSLIEEFEHVARGSRAA